MKFYICFLMKDLVYKMLGVMQLQFLSGALQLL